MLKNSKGLTIIELLVALSLSALVIMLAVQMYITNSRTFSVAEEQGKLTSQSQALVESVTRIAQESTGIEELVIDLNNNMLDYVVFAVQREEGTFYVKYTYDFEQKVMYISQEKDTIPSEVGTELVKNISSIQLELLPKGTLINNFSDATSIKVNLLLESSKLNKPIKYEDSTIMTFRNK